MKYWILILLILVGCSSDCSKEQERITQLTDKLMAYECPTCPSCPSCPICPTYKTTISDCQQFINSANNTQNLDTIFYCNSFIKQIARLENSLEECYNINISDCDNIKDDLEDCEDELNNLSDCDECNDDLDLCEDKLDNISIRKFYYFLGSFFFLHFL